MTILHCLDHGANLHESSWHMVSSAQDGLQAILLQLVCDVPANRNEATSATFAVASIFELCRSLAKRLEILRLLAAVWVQWGYLDHQNSFATATERRSIARLPPNTEWYRRLQHLQLHFGEFDPFHQSFHYIINQLMVNQCESYPWSIDSYRWHLTYFLLQLVLQDAKDAASHDHTLQSENSRPLDTRTFGSPKDDFIFSCI